MYLSSPLYTIRSIFRPIQPTVREDDAYIKYKEVRPDGVVGDFVYCYWQLKTMEQLEHAFNYRVVSDGCIDVLFNHQKPDENFVVGFSRKYLEFPLGEQFDYIGIRFLPAAFPLLFKKSAGTLVETTQALDLILPDLSHWISSQLLVNMPFDTIWQLIDEKLTTIIQGGAYELDTRFFDALLFILKKNGWIEAQKDLHTGISPRQLRRLFNYYIGTSPKAFSNVVRFQYILNAQARAAHPGTDKIYYDVGFYDQAHFIKTFKTFYGVTPSEAFR